MKSEIDTIVWCDHTQAQNLFAEQDANSTKWPQKASIRKWYKINKKTVFYKKNVLNEQISYFWVTTICRILSNNFKSSTICSGKQGRIQKKKEKQR